MPQRCAWSEGDPLYRAYHDREWGRPVHDDRRLFEFLILEGAQAGLSWITILRKREHYRKAFVGFDPTRVARFKAPQIARLMRDPGIVRNRAKIVAAVSNARAVAEIVREHRSLDRYLWSFVGGKPRVNRFRAGRIPYATEESEAMSKALRERGFGFVGPGICYSFMQACGLVNDHVLGCYLHGRVLPAPRV